MEALPRKSLTSGAADVVSKEDWKFVDKAVSWRVSEDVGELEVWEEEEEAFLPVIVFHSDMLGLMGS